MAHPRGEHITFPLSETEVLRLGFEVPDNTGQDEIYYGVILSAWDLKRGFARWEKTEGMPNPFTHEHASLVVIGLRQQLAASDEALKRKEQSIEEKIDQINKLNAEVNKWKSKNQQRATRIEELKQVVEEERTKASQAEASVNASETIVTGKEREIEKRDTMIEERDRTIARYQERYQSVDRPLTLMQRIAAKLFKI